MLFETKVKVCGIKTQEIAEHCIQLGVNFLGFNFSKQSSRLIDLPTAKDIVRTIEKTNVATVALFYKNTELEIRTVLDSLQFSYIQFVTEDSLETLSIIQEYQTELIPQFPIKPDFTINDLFRYNSDLMILDTYKQGQGGGSGETFSWSSIQNVHRKYLLAGGLNPQNVKRAIRLLHPFGVDVASGVESEPGIKDKNLLTEFIKNVKDQ
jgi:phosphoribosylanthranilate isomerase